MKALITSDIHVHKYKQFNHNNRRLKYGIKYLEQIFDYANENDIPLILIAGDLFNNMSIINTEVVAVVTESFASNFKRYPDIDVVAISGNHDYAGKNLIHAPATSAMEFLAAAFENFHLIDRGEYIRDGIRITGVPYFDYPEHLREDLSEIVLNPEQKNYLMMHQVVGMDNPMIKEDIDPNDPLFDGFDMVFNGHIHDGGSVTKKFINIGSPMHRTASDAETKKGFWTIDLTHPSTLEFQDITDHYPQFIHKEIGAELSEWEQRQYVIFNAPLQSENPDEQRVNDSFNLTLSQAQLIENFCKETVPAEKDKLEYGLQLLNR